MDHQSETTPTTAGKPTDGLRAVRQLSLGLIATWLAGIAIVLFDLYLFVNPDLLEGVA